jgi:hypothetical protein
LQSINHRLEFAFLAARGELEKGKAEPQYIGG